MKNRGEGTSGGLNGTALQRFRAQTAYLDLVIASQRVARMRAR
jgi:hypothetical protein